MVNAEAADPTALRSYAVNATTGAIQLLDQSGAWRVTGASLAALPPAQGEAASSARYGIVGSSDGNLAESDGARA